MMKYKGYIATVKYDDSVELFHGRVINSAPYPIVTFQGSDGAGLNRNLYEMAAPALVITHMAGLSH